MVDAILSGMLWILKSDLTKQQESSLKRRYTHVNPNNPLVPFSTYLELNGKLGVPFGDKKKLMDMLPTIKIQDKRIAPEFDTPKISSMELRDYQENAMIEILDYISKGGTEFNLSGNPGSGKSYMLANLLCKLNTKVLIIANQKMLISQISKEIETVLGEKPNILSSKNTQLGDINVATSQFIAQNSAVWYEIKHKIGLLVLDEAEALASPTVMRIFQRAPARYRIMISATFTRSVDHRTGVLLDFAGHKRIVLNNTALLKPTIINVLCPEVFFPPSDAVQYILAKGKFFKKPTVMYKALAITKYSISKNRQVLIACDLVDRQEELMDTLNKQGIKSACLNGKTKEVDRKRILQEYDSGDIKVIIGLGVLNAGLSLPKISTIIRLSTPSSDEKLEQLIGRGRRDFEGKEGCFVLDLWFKGFKNKKRLQMYSLKERTESWKVHTIEWDDFCEKYLNTKEKG